MLLSSDDCVKVNKLKKMKEQEGLYLQNTWLRYIVKLERWVGNGG